MYSIAADRRIVMASLYRSGEGSRLASIAPTCSNPARGQQGRAETGPAWLAVSIQHSAIMFAMHRQHAAA
jgi:hypothetical protein